MDVGPARWQGETVGVESAPGKKEPAKLRAFFAAVREVDKDQW